MGEVFFLLGDFFFFFLFFLVNVDVLWLRFFAPGLRALGKVLRELMNVMGFQAVNSCAAKRGCPLLPSRCQGDPAWHRDGAGDLGAATADCRRGSSL